MDIAKLKQLIDAEADGLLASILDDDELSEAEKNERIAAKLNEEIVSYYRPLESRELREWSGANERAANIRKAANKVSPFSLIDDNKWSVALLANSFLDPSSQDRLDFMNPMHAGMVAVLNSGTSTQVLTDSDVADLRARASIEISTAEEAGLTMVKPGHVEQARGG